MHSDFFQLMAQAGIDRNLGRCLLEYKNSIFHEPSHQENNDLTVIPELMFCMLHFLIRILERDLPELLHEKSGKCQCAEATHVRFPWVDNLDTLASDYIKRNFNVQEVIDVIMNGDSHDCFLVSLQKKYHFLCSIAYGGQSYFSQRKFSINTEEVIVL